MISEWLLGAAFALAPAIPAPALTPLTRTTSRLEFWISSRRRRAVRSNLEEIARSAHPRLLDARARDFVACSMFESYHRFLLEYLAQSALDSATLDARFRFSGMELLYRALVPGRGAVVCAPHVGNWELAGLAMARLGFRMHVVTGVQFNPRLSRGARTQKERAQIRVSTPQDGFRPLLQTLRRGGIVVLLTDGDVFVRSISADFFGRSVPFPIGPALLARRAQAPLVHAHAERTGAGHRVTFDGVEHPDRSLPLRTDLQRLTRRVAEAQERTIWEHVEQWCIFRPVFSHAA